MLRNASPGAPADARFGRSSFVQRFGASLNAHLHFHTCLVDGVFSAEGAFEKESGELRFHEARALGEAEVVTLQEVVRKRVLALFVSSQKVKPERLAFAFSLWYHAVGIRRSEMLFRRIPPQGIVVRRSPSKYSNHGGRVENEG